MDEWTAADRCEDSCVGRCVDRCEGRCAERCEGQVRGPALPRGTSTMGTRILVVAMDLPARTSSSTSGPVRQGPPLVTPRTPFVFISAAYNNSQLVFIPASAAYVERLSGVHLGVWCVGEGSEGS